MTTTDSLPVRLRPVTEGAIGTTAFFRNRALNQTLLATLRDKARQGGPTHYRVLFHACSIGAEVYSLVVSYLAGGFDQDFTLEVEALDMEPAFVNYAAEGCYDIGILKGMNADEQQYFYTQEVVATVSDAVKKHVTFLPACRFDAFETTQQYDVVCLLNAFIYVPAEVQAATIDAIASYNTGLFICSGFHADTIKADLQRHGYQPNMANMEAIHNGWLDRRVNTSGNEIRPGIYTQWSLPPFGQIADYEYRYCAIFDKSP